MTSEEQLLYEEQFINILMHDREMIRQWLSTPYGIKYFSPENECMLKAVIWAYNENVQLTRASFKIFSEQYIKSGPEAMAQLGVYNRILMRLTRRDDFPALLQRIRQAYIRRKTNEYFDEYNRNRKNGDETEANRLLAQRLNALENETISSKSLFIDLGNHKDDFMKELVYRKENPAQRITCGIKAIDHTMGVGFIKGGVTIFCAGPGAFKTTMLMNVGLNIFHLHNENVLFLPLEMPYEMMMQKIISRETRIPFDKIDRAEKLIDAEIRQIEMEFDKWKDLSNRFKVLKIADRAKISTIRLEIEKRITHFQPRIVIIDYVDNIVPESANIREDLKLRDMLEDMIKMGDNLGFHVITAAKLSRESLKRIRDQSENKHELDSTDIHGGQEFGANATAIYGQMRNRQQPVSLLDLLMMKSRYATPIFENGRTKTHLSIVPECGLIMDQSDTQGWGQDNVGNVAEDVMGTPPPDIEDEPFA